MKKGYEKPEVKDELTIKEGNSAWANSQPYDTDCFCNFGQTQNMNKNKTFGTNRKGAPGKHGH